jgi:hypothetical protein
VLIGFEYSRLMGGWGNEMVLREDLNKEVVLFLIFTLESICETKK